MPDDETPREPEHEDHEADGDPVPLTPAELYAVDQGDPEDEA